MMKTSSRGRAAQSVSPRWLFERLSAKWLRVLDVRSGGEARDDRSGPRLVSASGPPRFVEQAGGWSRVGHPSRMPGAAFEAGHIVGSTHLDVAARLFDRGGAVVTAPEIAMAMSEAGVGDEHTVVLVDDARTSAAQAAAWVLAHYGHTDTFILEGGFPRWRAEARPITTDASRRHAFASFTARTQAYAR